MGLQFEVSMDSNVLFFTDALTLPSAFSVATVLFGQPSSTAVATSQFIWDNITLVNYAGTQLLGNPSFEAGLLSAGLGVATGNWGYYVQSATTVNRVTSPVASGVWAVDITVPSTGGSRGGYAFQDVAQSFIPVDNLILELDFDLYRSSGSVQEITVAFDWDRGLGTVGSQALLRFNASTIDWSAFGGSGVISHTVSTGVWHHGVIRIGFNVDLNPPVTERWVTGFAWSES